MRYRRRTIDPIEAWQWVVPDCDSYHELVLAAFDFLQKTGMKDPFEYYVGPGGYLSFGTADDRHSARPNDWIIKSAGFYYSMEDKDFRRRYEPIEQTGYQYDPEKHP